MTDKTNDEKLRILRDRLAQIQEKSNSENNLSKRKDLNLEKDINNSIENSVEITSSKVNKKPILYIILFLLIGLSTFFYFTKTKTADIIEKTDWVDEVVEKEVIYSLKYKGNNIAVISRFLEESSAKAEVNNLITRGFKADYIYLPENSNISRKEYQVFIGPYETNEETNQWIKNIDKEISIINISDGTIIRTIKSSFQIKIEKEKAENERLAKEKVVNERLAKEKAEKKRLAIEKAENERLAIEKAENKRLAKDKAENEKIAKEKAENERLAKEKTENERLAKEKVENERIAKEKAEKKKIAKEKAENEKLAKEKAEKKRLAKEKAKKNKLAEDKARKLNLDKVADEKKRILEQEAENLKKEIALLKNRKILIANNKDIKIKYTYKFTETNRDEGFVTISNNAGYPIIKQTFINVESQGGSNNIVKGIKKIMKTNGMLIDQIYFQKDGNITPIYKGEISEVYN
ncbi:MAG: cell envelope integrity protein TolA [Flavobacteriales bacterium]|nr:cell envelope integrity protein TolA [Flavobacteriales bacterium]